MSRCQSRPDNLRFVNEFPCPSVPSSLSLCSFVPSSLSLCSFVPSSTDSLIRGCLPTTLRASLASSAVQRRLGLPRAELALALSDQLARRSTTLDPPSSVPEPYALALAQPLLDSTATRLALFPPHAARPPPQSVPDAPARREPRRGRLRVRPRGRRVRCARQQGRGDQGAEQSIRVLDVLRLVVSGDGGVVVSVLEGEGEGCCGG